MIEIWWRRLARWCRQARSGGRARSDKVQATGGADDAGSLPLPPEAPWGCGWFDSSHDLRQGLAVIEGPDAELVWGVERMLAPLPWIAGSNSSRIAPSRL